MRSLRSQSATTSSPYFSSASKNLPFRLRLAIDRVVPKAPRAGGTLLSFLQVESLVTPSAMRSSWSHRPQKRVRSGEVHLMSPFLLPGCLASQEYISGGPSENLRSGLAGRIAGYFASSGRRNEDLCTETMPVALPTSRGSRGCFPSPRLASHKIIGVTLHRIGPHQHI